MGGAHFAGHLRWVQTAPGRATCKVSFQGGDRAFPRGLLLVTGAERCPSLQLGSRSPCVNPGMKFPEIIALGKREGAVRADVVLEPRKCRWAEGGRRPEIRGSTVPPAGWSHALPGPERPVWKREHGWNFQLVQGHVSARVVGDS